TRRNESRGGPGALLERKGSTPYLRRMRRVGAAGAGWLGAGWPGAAGGVLLLPVLCLAADVRVVAVTPGRSADVVIDRSAPVTIEVGETVDGVKLLTTDRSGAVLAVDGVTKTLQLV